MTHAPAPARVEEPVVYLLWRRSGLLGQLPLDVLVRVRPLGRIQVFVEPRLEDFRLLNGELRRRASKLRVTPPAKIAALRPGPRAQRAFASGEFVGVIDIGAWR